MLLGIDHCFHDPLSVSDIEINLIGYPFPWWNRTRRLALSPKSAFTVQVSPDRRMNPAPNRTTAGKFTYVDFHFTLTELNTLWLMVVMPSADSNFSGTLHVGT